MQYQVYYDIEGLYPHWWIFAFGLLIVCRGVFGLLRRKGAEVESLDYPSGLSRRSFPLMSVIGGSFIIGAGWLNYSRFAELRDAALSGKAVVVEGQVQDFIPMPYTGHARESFVVNGQPFSYSDYDLTDGFNQSQSHGGPIAEGLRVRISHVGGKIVKLEIPR